MTSTCNGSDRTDTRQALEDLVLALGDGRNEDGTLKIRKVARILDVNHAALIGALNGKRPAITLDTLAEWSRRAEKEAGISLTFWVGPDKELRHHVQS